MSEDTGLIIKQQLEALFVNEFYIDFVKVIDINQRSFDFDLLIYSSDEVKDACSFIVYDNEKSIVSKRVIRQLKSHGLNHIRYNQYYPGIESYKCLDIAITPGEMHLVPGDISNVIDIKSRQLDITTLIEILKKLNCMDKYGSIVSSYFYRDMITISKKYIKKSQESTRFENLLTNLLDNQKNGIIYTNIENKAIILNEESLKLLEINKKDIISKNIYEIFEGLKEDIINIKNREILVSKEKIEENNVHVGNMIILNEVKYIHEIDDEVRKKN